MKFYIWEGLYLLFVVVSFDEVSYDEPNLLVCHEAAENVWPRGGTLQPHVKNEQVNEW